MLLRRLISRIFLRGSDEMKTTCFCKKTEDIVIKNLDDVIVRKDSKKNTFTNYAWTDRSVKVIKENYPKVKNGEMTITELCRRSGKSYSAVRNKVRRMGFHGEMNYQ